MRRKRGEADSFSVSFLDVAACGFGAMIILLMITKSGEPISIELQKGQSLNCRNSCSPFAEKPQFLIVI